MIVNVKDKNKVRENRISLEGIFLASPAKTQSTRCVRDTPNARIIGKYNYDSGFEIKWDRIQTLSISKCPSHEIQDFKYSLKHHL